MFDKAQLRLSYLRQESCANHFQTGDVRKLIPR